LKQRGFTSTPDSVEAVLKAAKRTDHVMSEFEITQTLARELLRERKEPTTGD
jgi:hypothetical protein